MWMNTQWSHVNLSCWVYLSLQWGHFCCCLVNKIVGQISLWYFFECIEYWCSIWQSWWSSVAFRGAMLFNVPFFLSSYTITFLHCLIRNGNGAGQDRDGNYTFHPIADFIKNFQLNDASFLPNCHRISKSFLKFIFRQLSP